MQYDSYSTSKEPVKEHPVLLTKKGKEIKDADNFSKVGYTHFAIPVHNAYSYSTKKLIIICLVWFHLQRDIEEINRLYECNEIQE